MLVTVFFVMMKRKTRPKVSVLVRAQKVQRIAAFFQLWKFVNKWLLELVEKWNKLLKDFLDNLFSTAKFSTGKTCCEIVERKLAAG